MAKIVYLVSDMGGYKKEINSDGTQKRTPCRLNNKNGLVDAILTDLNKQLNVVFVASNETSYDLTDMYAEIFKMSLKLTGFEILNFVVLDGRTKNETEEIINGANLIYLCGGHVPSQNEFINKINLIKYLSDFNGVIIGQSAGAMNLATTVYAQPEITGEAKDKNFKRWLKGLGETDINLLPHYNVIADDVLDGFSIIHDITFSDSFVRPIVIIPDGTYIRIEQEIAVVSGNAWIMKNGIMKKICNDDERIKMNNRLNETLKFKIEN